MVSRVHVVIVEAMSMSNSATTQVPMARYVPISIILGFGRARPERLANIYWLAFGLAAVAMLVTYFLLRSRIGIGLTAMRDNEEGAAAPRGASAG